MNITQQQFEDYEWVRQSGMTNMMDVYTVEKLSGLNREEIHFIMRNYTQLKLQFSN